MSRIVKFSEKKFPEYMNIGAKSSENSVFFVIRDHPFVMCCNKDAINFDYILENNIDYQDLSGCAGSCVVESPGDVAISAFGDQHFIDDVLNRIVNLISYKVAGNKLVNNDFVYDYKKYGAFVSMPFMNKVYLGVHISNYIDQELISKICYKKSIKIPTPLPSPLTEEEILEAFKDFKYASYL